MSDMQPAEKRCKTCGTPLIVKETKRSPAQLIKQYYYTAYYFCQKCKKMYHDDAFKVVNKNYDLFTHDILPPHSFDVEIWTDGACSHNGTKLAKAAWAFVASTEGRDYEAKGFVEGKQTNNTAEAYAIYHALLWAGEKRYKIVRIHSDSQITIHNLQRQYHLIKENREIFQKIAVVVAKHKLSIIYVKVPGHAGDINNERADKLANGLVGIQ